jgi:catechol 2,3-dioxygenase-like lactoylglutathione lyase family enzyme
MQPPPEPPFTLDHLDHVVLNVQDLEKSTAFYRMLGGQVGTPGGAGTPVRITEGQTIILQSHPEYQPATLGALDHLNLHIRATDLQPVLAYLRAHGVEGIHETGTRGDTVRVLDPDRNVIEIRITGRGRAGREP